MTDQHEFDANDDEAVNVFYDLTVWDADQRSALVESLAAASVPMRGARTNLLCRSPLKTSPMRFLIDSNAKLGRFPSLSATMTKPSNFNLMNGRYLSAGAR